MSSYKFTIKDITAAISRSFKSRSVTEDDCKIIDSLSSIFLMQTYFSDPGYYPIISKYLNNYFIYSMKGSDIVKLFIEEGYTSTPYPKFKNRKKDNPLIEECKELSPKEADLFISLSEFEYSKTDGVLIKKDISEIKETKKEKPDPIPQEVSSRKIHCIEIPDKYYSDKYALFDIQQTKKNLLYIFINTKTGNKTILKEKKQNYCYVHKAAIRKYDGKIEKISRPMENLKNLVLFEGANHQIKDTYPDKYIYEGDVKLPLRHSIDYYYRKENEPTYRPKICYLDIETTQHKDAFNYNTCPADITMIGYTIDKTFYINLLLDKEDTRTENDLKKMMFERYKNKDPKAIEDIKDWRINKFTSERTMVLHFFTTVMATKTALVTAWNIRFDIGYLIRKAEKYGITSILNKYGDYFIDTSKKGDERFSIPGLVIVDLLDLYKGMQQNRKASYALKNVAYAELKDDDLQKLEMKGDILDIVVYNRRDVMLIEKLDQNLNIISSYNMLRQLSNNVWSSVLSKIGLIEGLQLMYLKRHNRVARNNITSITEKFAMYLNSKGFDIYKKYGGYNQASVGNGALKQFVSDFDCKSMYPSIIQTFNLSPNSLRYTVMDRLPDSDVNLMEKYLWDPKSLNFDMEVNVIKDELHILENDQPEILKMTLRELDKIIRDNKYIVCISGGIFANHADEIGIYHPISTDLISRRDAVRASAKKMSDQFMIRTADAQQWALKILNNAIFGATGFSKFRFLNLTFFNSITKTGREFGKTVILSIEENLQRFVTTKNVSFDNRYPFEHIWKKIRTETDFIKQGDLKCKRAFYSDTDSTFVEYNDFIKDKKNPIPEILPVLDIVDKIIKDAINNVYTIHHDVISNDNKFMMYKTEWVAARGLFFTKKRYAAYIIYKDNKPVDAESKDSREIRGIELRRSEFPAYTKKCLSDLLDKVLRTNISLGEIQKVIYDYEVDIMTKIQSKDKSICKVINLKKEITDYKLHSSVPGHIKGILFWNALFPEKKFKIGDTGSYYNISGANQFLIPPDKSRKIQELEKEFKIKFDSICVPEEEILPAYIIIDSKKMLDFAWIKRWKGLLNPIFETEKIDMQRFSFNF